MTWLNEVSRVRWYNLQELKQEVQKCTLTSFVALEKRSDPRMKNEQGISFATMLQHQSDLVKNFLAKKTITTLKHSPYSDSAPANFTCSLD